MNVFTATRHLAFVEKLFAAAGLDLKQLISANDENALKAHIEAKSAPTVAEPTDEQLVALVEAELREILTASKIIIAEGQNCAEALAAHLSAVASRIDASTQRVHTITTALDAANIVIAADAKPEQITKSINDRVAVLASELLAKHGLTSFPGNEPSADPSSPGGPNTKTMADWRSLDAHGRAQFFRDGGRLID